MKANLALSIVALLLMASVSAGCLNLGAGTVGEVKITVIGAGADVDVTAVVENSIYNYTYDVEVKADSTLERTLSDVPVDSYYVTLYYHGVLQERRIIEVVGGETTEVSFTIHGAV